MAMGLNDAGSTRSVLVTGGAGYIGAHACKALAASGYRPVVYDNLVRGHRRAVLWGPLEEGHIADAARLDEVFGRHRPIAVMHFAALSEVGQSFADPLAFYANNVSGSLVLAQRAIAHGVGAFVFSSTCAVYGTPERSPIGEDAPTQPINPYGRSKLMVETALRDAVAAHELDVVALRYFNAAGASRDAEIGEDHEPETHLIPRVLMAARDQGRIIGVNGTDYPTRDGSCVRDYIHVDDLAEAHVAALDRLLEGALDGFTALNLGTGKGHSVLDIVTAAERITGRRIRTETKPRRAGDAPRLVADPGAAFRVLDWRPRSSDLDTMLSTAWHWTQRQAADELPGTSTKQSPSEPVGAGG
jgi:UDP-glucose-4-epimerase GalE